MAFKETDLLPSREGTSRNGWRLTADAYAFTLAIALLVIVGLVDAAGRGFPATAQASRRWDPGVGLLARAAGVLVRLDRE